MLGSLGRGPGRVLEGSGAWRRAPLLLPLSQSCSLASVCAACLLHKGSGASSVSLQEGVTCSQNGGGSAAGCARHSEGLRSRGTLLGAGRSQDGVGWVVPEDERQTR